MKRVCSLGLFALLISPPSMAECGKVTIADMNWNTASFIAHLDQYILNKGYDCEAELVPGDSMPTGISMIEKGQPDVAPELWTNSVKKALDLGVAEKRLRYAGRTLSDGGEEGFWVPKYLIEQYPEMKTINGVIKHAHLFRHPESDQRHAFYGCPSGWTCQHTANHLFNALNLQDAGFEIIDPGSSAGLSGSIAKAYERQEPWFGYYWAPTATLGKYEMVKVDFESGVDEKAYIECITKPECKTPTVTMYPSAPVHTIVTEEFAARSPIAYAYFQQRSFTNQQLNHILAWMEDNLATGEDAMYYFLETQPKVWQKWVSADVAKKVQATL